MATKTRKPTGHFNRRNFLQGTALLGATSAAAGCTTLSDVSSMGLRSADGSGTTLIKGGFLYAADEANTTHPNSWVLVEGKYVKAVGSDPSSAPKADRVIDASGKLVLPGFVNPHWHESFVEGPERMKPDDSDLATMPFAMGGNIDALSSYFGVIADVGEKLTPQEALAISRWSLWTQLRAGTTALGDIGSLNSTDAMAEAAIDLGMRIRVSRWGSDIKIPLGSTQYVRIADWEKQANDWEALMAKWDKHPSGLVGGMPTVLAAFGSSDEQLIAMREIAKKYGSPYAAHVAPLKNEAAALRPIFGRSAIERFDHLGMVTDKLLSVHTAWASPSEYKRYVDERVNVVYSPANYALLGERTISETRQAGQFLKDGMTISCSTDGNISYTGGMPEAMRASLLMINESMNDNAACPPTTALAMGTRHGAIALGWGDRIGSIEPGKEADIVLIGIDDWRYRLITHPLSIYLIAGGSQDVDTVMIAGQVVVENGKSKLVDEEKMFADYEDAVAKANKRLFG